MNPDPQPPLLYFNGFEVQIGNSDFGINLHQSGKHVMTLKFSYTTGKSLSDGLQKAVAHFQDLTTHSIMSVNEVNLALQKHKENQVDAV